MLLLRALRTLILGIVVGGVAVGACLAALIPGAAEVVSAHHYTVKTVTKLRDLSQKSTVYWADGSPMDELGLQNRQNVTYAELAGSPGGVRVINAVIATEDQTFWTNDGIDLGAVFRAFVSNVTSGKIEQGGSTITQQLVKNRILSPARDVNRKVKEIEDALRLNEKFSKQKILEEYLNTVYFGQNSYGIKSAASRFFITTDPGASFPRGKTLQELTIGEAALLAGVIANPEGTNPFKYPQRAWLRRADVLQAEVDQGYITQAEADAAKNEPLPKSLPPDELRPSNYLTAEVQDRLLNDGRLGSTPKARHDALLKGGLQIYTTFDKNLQNLATAATQDALPRSPSGPDWVSSLVAIDPATGAVKAMVGGPDYADSEYNIATHPIGRQPGSTWKVITVAAALANGYSPNDTVNGNQPCRVPSKFPAPDAFTVNAGDGEGGFADLWTQTAHSVNCAFVRLSTSVGQDTVMDMAHKMGITQQRLFPHLTLSIGDIEATPLEMATVTATIANGGVHQAPYFVQNVVGPNGLPLSGFPEIERPGDRVLDQDVAECEQIILRGVITGGTGTSYTEVPGHEPFGKTGTTDKLGDAWFIGATPQLATAVWFGNRTTNSLRAGFGGPTSGPIWRRFMQDALADQPDIPLPDRESNAVCNRPGKAVNQDGGRGAPVSAPQPSNTPVTPRQPTVITQTPPAPTTTTTSPPVTTSPGPGRGKAVTSAAALESLLTLQDHDAALDRLTHRRNTLPERDTVARGEAEVGALAAQIRTVTAQRDELAQEEKRLDDEASSLREKAGDVEAKMYSGSVSSPRELQAMQADVEQLRRHERTLESRELELMESLEPLDAELDRLGTQRTTLAAELNVVRATLESAGGAIDKEIAEEQKARDALAGELEPTLMSEYERRRARAQGVGVARLVGNTCQGCHLSIPATEVDAMRRAPEGTISYCDNCGCILLP